MEKGNKNSSIENQIRVLTEQYEEALKSGAEFSLLKDIRDKLRALQGQAVENNQSDSND